MDRYMVFIFLSMPCELIICVVSILQQLGYGDDRDRGKCNTSNEDISNLLDINLGTDFEIQQIEIMQYHGCVLSTENELKCWGK